MILFLLQPNTHQQHAVVALRGTDECSVSYVLDRILTIWVTPPSILVVGEFE